MVGADVLVVKPSITSLRSLQGRSIGVELGGVSGVMLFAILERAGLGSDQVSVVDLPVHRHLEAWQNGTIEASICYQPTESMLLRAGGARLFDSRQIPDTIFDTLVVTEQAARRRPEAVKDLVLGHFRGLRHPVRSMHDAVYCLVAGGGSPGLLAQQEVTLGIFAYRPAPVIEERYTPLADYLSEQSGLPVRLRVLNQDDMNRALAANQIDFFLTNPSHFLVIRSDRSLTGVLATLQRAWQGQSTGSIGGVILTRAARDDINGLADLRGKSIATPGVYFLGGYQSPALELMDAGVDVLRNNRMVHLGNHDRVIRAVRTGDVDVGFVRTGVLEELTRDDPALMTELKVINRQHLSGYPFVVSTRLYPEWPLVSLPHVESGVVRRIASALFALERDHPAATTASISGFAPPADYQSVEELARVLRMAPYDHVPRQAGRQEPLLQVF